MLPHEHEEAAAMRRVGPGDPIGVGRTLLDAHALHGARPSRAATPPLQGGVEAKRQGRGGEEERGGEGRLAGEQESRAGASL